jgi:hypothetical protein
MRLLAVRRPQTRKTSLVGRLLRTLRLGLSGSATLE